MIFDIVFNNPNKIKSLVAIATFQYLASITDEEIVPDSLLKGIMKYVNPNNISDNVILSNTRIQNNIRWDKLKKYKLIRIWSRNLELIEKVDISKFDFTVMDLYPLFLINPDFIDYFNVNFDSLTNQEIIRILECDIKRVDSINIEQINFNNKETLDVIKKFGNNDEIMDRVNLKGLDHYNLRALLKKTGEKYIQKVDTSKLKASDWIDILKSKPSLLEYCNMLLFEKNDCFNLVKLVEIYPENPIVFELIENNKNSIPAIGWERLLIINPKKYSEICIWDSLNKKHWDSIVDARPELIDVKKRYV